MKEDDIKKWLEHIYSRSQGAYNVIGFWVAKTRLDIKKIMEEKLKQIISDQRAKRIK